MISVFLGSTPSDFPEASGIQSPFEPCPDTPNCVIYASEFDLTDDRLFEITRLAVESMNPHKIHVNSQSHQIDAVFRIPVFGFKDDVTIFTEPAGESKSMLHIKSASRVGYSDLGVNRRRIKRIINGIQQNINNQ